MGDSTLAQVAAGTGSYRDKAAARTGEARAENKPGGPKTSPDGDETRAGVDGRRKCRQRSANDKPKACKRHLKRHYLLEDAADCGGGQVVSESYIAPRTMNTDAQSAGLAPVPTL